MSKWAIHKDSKITAIYYGPESEAAMQLEVGEAYLAMPDHLDDLMAYVFDGAITSKTDLPISINKNQIVADGNDTATISGIPASVTVTWPDDLTEEVTDGVVEFAIDLPGTYTLTFDSVPYLKQEVTIEAVSAT